MPKPTYYGIMTTNLYTTLLMSFGHFIMPPTAYPPTCLLMISWAT